jgi:hypothetical protein
MMDVGCARRRPTSSNYGNRLRQRKYAHELMAATKNLLAQLGYWVSRDVLGGQVVASLFGQAWAAGKCPSQMSIVGRQPPVTLLVSPVGWWSSSSMHSIKSQ